MWAVSGGHSDRWQLVGLQGRWGASVSLRTISHNADLPCLATKQALTNTAKEKRHLWGIHEAHAKKSVTAFLISIPYLGPALQGDADGQECNVVCVYFLLWHGGRREANFWEASPSDTNKNNHKYTHTVHEWFPCFHACQCRGRNNYTPVLAKFLNAVTVTSPSIKLIEL